MYVSHKIPCNNNEEEMILPHFTGKETGTDKLHDLLKSHDLHRVKLN